jgi:hypothetical protein
MDGYQYKGNGSPGGILYNSPNLYDSKDFSDIYYGRIYSGGAGDMYASYWSQWGGSVNWSVSENTSVWDTTATSAILSSTGNTCGALRVHPGARLTIGPIGDLTASGNSEINEVRGLNIQADATGMGQFLDNGTIAYNTGGSVQAECRFQQDRWHEYCSPFASTNARPYYLMYMKYYQEPSDHWKYVWNDGWWPTDTILDGTKMTGYAMWAASTGPYINSGMVRPYGSLNTGNVNATITWSTYSGGGHNGYNLVGNPYPSAIDLHDAGIGWGAITKSAWIYDPALHDYRTWLYGGGGTYGSGSNIIAPQQGFIIRGTIASDVFGMVNAARRINHMTFVKDQPEIYDRLVLDVSCSQNTYGDEMAVRFLDSAKPSYDDMYDAYKLYGASEAPQLYSIIPGDSTLTVNSLPWSGINQVVPLGFQCGTNDSFTITASNLQTFRSGVVIYLEDTANAGGGFYNLTLNNNYSFTANAGTSNGRFFLHFYNPFFGVNEHTDAGLQIYSFDSYVYVKNHFQGVTSGVITIYDMIGKTVFQNNLKNANLNKFNPGLMQGYYIVKVVTAENVYTQKVYLK